MSSTNKTDNINLNSWLSSDKPERTDFNYDNEVIDKVLADHFSNTGIHVSSDEKSDWSEHTYIGVYFGNGDTSRVVKTKCSFTPKIAIVFALNRTPVIHDTVNEKTYNYLGFAVSFGSSYGISLTGDSKSDLSVANTLSASYYIEYANFNESGVGYCYMLFK